MTGIRITLLLGALAIALALADLGYDKHGYFELEQLPGFHGALALAAALLAIAAAMILRALLSRAPDYYAPKGVDSEAHPSADLGKENGDA
ncbi:MAG: hypothetical protein RIC04_10165 [Parvibaculum sp.]|uniref:hypothetical protein n=1 Tax=Parvibaculum sp. TaxID=2024848 RepID=UPI0032EFE019